MFDLTPKQEAFAQAYVETSNASEAYRRSYSASKMKQPAIEVEASRLLDHPKVALRVHELRERARKRHDINVDTITEMLKEDRELARNNNQTSAAVTAVMGMAKLHGLLVDKQEQSGPNGGPVETHTKVEWVVVDEKDQS
jgi:phage terminase small subunit